MTSDRGSRVVAGLAVTAALMAGTGLAPRSAEGQVPDSVSRDSVSYQLEDLRVRTTRPLSTTAGASAVRLSLETPRLAPVPLLADALRSMPFIQVRENSRGEQQLTLRGTESRQVAVLFDGVPLTLGWDARTDLGVIPTDAARELRLFRGLSSVLHGPNVLGGIVDIDLASGGADGSGEDGANPSAPGSSIQAGVDATGATAFGAKYGSSWDVGSSRLTVQAGAGYRQRDALPLARDVAQPIDPLGDDRLNSDLEHASGFLAARLEGESGAWASLSGFGFGSERGVPPELHVVDPRLWRLPNTSRIVTSLSAGTAWGETPLGRGDIEASLGLDVGDQQIDSYESLAYDTVEESEFYDDRTVTARIVADHTLGSGMLRSAFTWADTRHDERIDDEPWRRFSQRLYSLGAEVEHPVTSATGSFWSGVRLTAGGSFDHARTPETGGIEPRDPLSAWGARVGGSAVVGTGRLHLGLSRKVRFPSLRELYSGALGRFVPNPDLSPETLRTVEAGLTGTLDALGGAVDAQAVLFHQRFSDAIVRTGLGDGRFQRQNRSTVRAAGLEVLTSIRWDAWTLGGDMTWQDVEQNDPLSPAGQTRVEYQPEIAGSLNLAGPMFAGIIGRTDLAMVGRQYCVDPELGTDVALSRTARLDVTFVREWSIGGAFRTIQATAGVQNVADAAIFDQCGLPQPGRVFRLSFRIF